MSEPIPRKLQAALLRFKVKGAVNGYTTMVGDALTVKQAAFTCWTAEGKVLMTFYKAPGGDWWPTPTRVTRPGVRLMTDDVYDMPDGQVISHQKLGNSHRVIQCLYPPPQRPGPWVPQDQVATVGNYRATFEGGVDGGKLVPMF